MARLPVTTLATFGDVTSVASAVSSAASDAAAALAAAATAATAASTAQSTADGAAAAASDVATSLLAGPGVPVTAGPADTGLLDGSTVASTTLAGVPTLTLGHKYRLGGTVVGRNSAGGMMYSVQIDDVLLTWDGSSWNPLMAGTASAEYAHASIASTFASPDDRPHLDYGASLALVCTPAAATNARMEFDGVLADLGAS